MITIGFRAEPSAVNWAVVEGTKETPIKIDAGTLTTPATYDEAAALKWFREKVTELVCGLKPEVAAVRYPETFLKSARQASLNQRCRVEGVIVETLQSLGLRVLTGSLATISKNLGSKAAKHYLDAPDLRGLNWEKYRPNVKEAILVAASALPER